MTRDIETLAQIIKWLLFAAAFSATAFPVLYAFSPWWSTTLGRLLMFKAVSFALALDVTVLFQFWQPEDILIYFWVEAITFALIAVSTGLLAIALIRWNYIRWKKENRNDQ